jgi:hypothetical protein
MGQEARCRVEIDGVGAEARVLLESEELVVRGEGRRKIPFAEMTRVESAGGNLMIEHGGRRVVLALGDRAATWAERIRNPRTLLDKLGVKPGARVSLLGIADDGFRALLRTRTEDIADGEAAPESDLVLFGVDTVEDLDRVGSLEASIKRDGGIWMVSPRGRSDLTEADILAAGRAAGLVDTKVARFSDTHTAHRFAVPKARR